MSDVACTKQGPEGKGIEVTAEDRFFSRKIEISDNVSSTRIGDETVMLHFDSGNYLGLDQVGTSIWEKLQASVALDQLCDEIAKEFDAPISTIRSDTKAFIEQLEAQKVVKIEK